MEYNTVREPMTIPEYGRNIQKMIEYTLGIEDREKRSKSAAFIVRVMGQIKPDNQESGDYQQTLWDHLHIIANYKLDVDSPYPKPEKDLVNRRPAKISYSDKRINLRHYGKTIQQMIDKAIAFEEGEEKEALIFYIANYLKRSYLTWNRESVNDATILDHLKEISEGKLEYTGSEPLVSVSEVVPKKKIVQQQKKKKPGKGQPMNKGTNQNRKKR